MPEVGPCTGTAHCTYDVNGKPLPTYTPCAYGDVDCGQGQWSFSHNDPGTSQCGWNPNLVGEDSGAGFPDECSPLGGTCIDPQAQECPVATTPAPDLSCSPWPSAYCCLPTKAAGQPCVHSGQCDGYCLDAPYIPPFTLLSSPLVQGLCVTDCDADSCAPGFKCVSQPLCPGESSSCGACQPECSSTSPCAVGTCVTRQTITQNVVSVCDPLGISFDGGI